MFAALSNSLRSLLNLSSALANSGELNASSFSSYVLWRMSLLRRLDIVSYAQDPGVRDRRGGGIGRFGSGLPVLGQMFFVSDDVDAAILVDAREMDVGGANASA